MTVLHRQGFDSVGAWSAAFWNRAAHSTSRGRSAVQRQAHDEVMRTLKDLTAKLDALAQARGQA